MQTGCVVEVARELCLLTQQLHKILLVGVPVGDVLACYSTLYCSLGNSRTHLCDKTRVDGFRDEVFRTEREVVNGVGKGEHDWLGCHRANHILREHVALRESDEHVGALHGFFKGVYVSALCGEQGFLRSEVLTVGGDNTLRVEHHDILYFCAKRILQAGCRDDGCAVLVVVHHGDVEGLLQTLFDVEALWSLNVLKVDAAEGRRNLLYCLAELLRIFLGNLDVEHIDAAVYLKEQAFAFHNRFAAHRSNVAKT